MAKDFSGQTFRYGGKKYTFQATLRSIDEEVNVVLDNNAVKVFEYESELNSLLIRGSIEYTDAYGNVDKLLEKPGSYCEIAFVENEQEFDGTLTIEKLSDTNKFYGTFLVENIGITDRRSNQIDYKIDLVSSNVYKCSAVVDYSNYAVGKQPVFDILKACLVQSGFEPDKDSFDAVKSPVKLNYITNGNDDIASVVKYLFSKLYYYSDRDDSLKFMLWNETTSKPQLFDIKDKSTSTGVYSVVLSLLKSKHESLTQEEQNRIATVTRLPMSQSMKTVFDTQVSDYDYGKNAFVTRDITSKNLARYFNATYDSETKLLEKQQPVSRQSGQNYLRRGAYWNNDFNCYGDMVRVLTKYNALLIETSGEILRKPAAMVDVAIDRDTHEVTTEDPKKLEDLMTRYRGLEGTWFASRVHHYVYPQQSKYRQWLALVRNYTIDLENKEEKS